MMVAFIIVLISMFIKMQVIMQNFFIRNALNQMKKNNH